MNVKFPRPVFTWASCIRGALDEGLLVIAGFVAKTEVWTEEFAPEWNARLAQDDLDKYTTDNLPEENDKESEQLLSDLSELVVKHISYRLTVVVPALLKPRRFRE